MIKDFLGNDLNIGDKVVLTRPRYREFVMATIVAFTPQKVRVEYKRHYGNSIGEYLSEPNFLVKI